MTDRERLLDILSKPIFPHELVDPLEAVADYLLDNGVTFATGTDIGCNCDGCYWKAEHRHQKCSCCRRNRYLKDCYEPNEEGRNP